MELTQVKMERSPLSANRIRLSGEVVYDRPDVSAERYWFDLDERYGADLLQSGDPWLVALLPLAMSVEEPLSLPLPVDPVLLENVRKVIRIWQCWDPALRPASIQAPPRAPGLASGKRSAAFFSGGIDSTFTVLRHVEGPAGDGVAVDDLLYIWGFDIPWDNAVAFQSRRARLAQAADELGKPLIDVAMNFHGLRWGRDFPFVHGCGLAAIAHVLGPRYGQALIASTGGYRDLSPYGSHVLTDPLLSSSRLAILHDGAEFSRVEKIARVAASPVAMRALHVCPREGVLNCGKCRKCHFTLLALDVLGYPGPLDTFRSQPPDAPPEFSGKKHKEADDKICVTDWLELRAVARAQAREDVAREVDRVLRQQRLSVRLQPLVHRIRRWPRGARVLTWASRHPTIQQSLRALADLEADGVLVRSSVWPVGARLRSPDQPIHLPR